MQPSGGLKKSTSSSSSATGHNTTLAQMKRKDNGTGEDKRRRQQQQRRRRRARADEIKCEWPRAARSIHYARAVVFAYIQIDFYDFSTTVQFPPSADIRNSTRGTEVQSCDRPTFSHLKIYKIVYIYIYA